MGRMIIDQWRANAQLSPDERRLADWVKGRPDDVQVIFSTVYPEEGEPFSSVGVEEKLPDGRIAVQWVDLLGARGFPEVWEHTEKLARAGLEQVIEQEARRS